jgi:methionine synthase II (cobalamin-independent)
MMPLLPTTVVGSYSVPEWLERLKTDYYRNRISRSHLGEIHDMAIKAALKDQERAGIDIVSDGELRRDNDIDYLLARISGVQIPVTVKSFYYDYYDIIVADPLPTDPPPLGLADDYRFTREYTDRPVKFSFTPDRSRCPIGSRTRRIPSPSNWSARWRRCSTPRHGRWRRRVQICYRSMSRSWPATQRTWGWRWRRLTS